MDNQQLSGSHRIWNRISDVCSYGVTILTGAVLFYLLLLSLFSTSYLSDKEAVFYVSDHPVLLLLVLVFLVAAVVFIRNSHCLSKVRLPGVSTAVLLGIWFLILAGLVMVTLQSPIYDQNKIFQAAGQILHMDFSSYLPGGYVERYSNQQGIVLLFALIFRIFGEGNYAAIQLLNAAALVVMGFCMDWISRRIFRQTGSKWIVPAFLLFLPLWGYVTFVYGTLYSTAFALTALLLLIRYLKENRWYFLLGSSVCMALSILIKMNSVILLIAMVILLLVRAMEERKPRILLGILLLVGMTIFGNFLLKTYVNQMTDGLYSRGIPRSGHIAMGLQESGTRAPGWYNGYIENTYEETGYDYAEMEERAGENIQASLQNFREHPTYAVGFFVRKTASQWNEPTFEAVFIQQNRNSQIQLPVWLRVFLENTVWNHALTELLNILQSVIYFGALVYLILSRKEKGFLRLIFAVMFLGGFLFHLLWEASSQYTVVYFILLIPYAVMGFYRLSDSFTGEITIARLNKAPAVRAGTAGILLVLLLSLSGQNLVTSVILLNRDDAAYADYTRITPTTQTIRNGRYQICLAENPSMVLTVENEGREDELPACVIQTEKTDMHKLTAFYEKGAYTLRFAHSGKALDVQAAGTEPGTIVQQYEGNGDVSQQWQIQKNEDGSCTIFYTDTLVLTANMETGQVTVEKNTSAPGQRWIFQK